MGNQLAYTADIFLIFVVSVLIPLNSNDTLSIYYEMRLLAGSNLGVAFNEGIYQTIAILIIRNMLLRNFV